MSIELNTKDEKISYALGLDIGTSFQRLPVDISLPAVFAAMEDVFGNNKPQLDQDEFQALMSEFQQNMQAEAQKLQGQMADKNLEEGKAFLEANKAADGVTVTDSGLQYVIVEEGNGSKPASTDTVSVHYTGTLIDGTVFDSSVQRGEPATFPLNGVIPGWTEGLQTMAVGGKTRFFIPSDLAYGERGAGEVIGPNSTLIFDVELLDIK